MVLENIFKDGKNSVDKKDIATVIGKVEQQEIVEVSGAKVDINDEGVVTIGFR